MPGRKRWAFLMPPAVEEADLRAALDEICLRGALPPVVLRAVCFVRAISEVSWWSSSVGEGKERCAYYVGLWWEDPLRALYASPHALIGDR